MIFVPGLFPAFAFNKDILLYLGLTFIAVGLTQTFYCYIRIRQLERKLSIK